MRERLLVLSLIVSFHTVVAQQPVRINMKDPVICYGRETDHSFTIPPPEEYLRWKAGARVKTANIEIIFNPGFTAEAQAAFRAAADIWETLITSSQTITIDAHWRNDLGAGVLGGALYTSAMANFDGAQKRNVFYPIALAEKISGQNLNGDEPEIFTQFSSTTNWHYNANEPPPAGKYDLVTVVLHEIGHGLGISGSFSVTGNQGDVGVQTTTVPIIYDVPIENGTNANLIETFASPSAALAGQLTGQSLFFDSHSSNRPRLYAPTPFNQGSSISHLDENTFNQTANSLMTPFVGTAERMHNPGVALNMLKDMGWENILIAHEPLANTENAAGPYTITATIQADIAYDDNSVTLNYSTNGSGFTALDMTVTGNPNEFTAVIPTTNLPATYSYFISLSDNSGRQFVNPGKIVSNQQPQVQGVYTFETGPDTDPPVITHNPKLFLLAFETETSIEAKVTDNIGVGSVVLEYRINGGSINSQPFTLTAPEEDSVYTSTIVFGVALAHGNTVEYRIRATDNSVAENEGVSPSSGFHVVNVIGLEPVQDSYANDFNAPANDDDFFGNGFTITQPGGFSDRGLHSEHPYINGDGFPDNERSLMYQLRVPVRVKDVDATLKFDEIALIEPGAAGSVFGAPDFFDYVIVEGSKDGGITWDTLLPGYDARANSAWLQRYQSAEDTDGNSTAVGDPSLYRSRTINLLATYDAGDEVVVRFRVYIDQLAFGWGWAIDNLKIQIDETPPVVLHNHVDYLVDGTDVLSLVAKASDAGGIRELKLEYIVNSNPVQTEFLDVDPPQSEYAVNVPGVAALAAGDVLQYRFVATDSADLEGFFPATGFIQVPVIQFGTPVTTYTNNFNAASDDFAGNFFSVAQPAGFANGGIHSSHVYPLGLGLDRTSNFSYTLKKPITISGDNPHIRFDEIAVVEGHPVGAVFGTPAFRDYVIVEGSKDDGETWLPFLNGYDALEQTVWNSAFNNQASGTSSMFRTKLVNMTDNGNFAASDEVLIRFRLFSNETANGWGWAIDNLHIQDIVTGTEQQLEAAVSVYPNPANGNILVEAEGLSSSNFNIQLTNAQGQHVYHAIEQAINGKMSHNISGAALPAGLYIVKISNAGRTVMRKLMKVD